MDTNKQNEKYQEAKVLSIERQRNEALAREVHKDAVIAVLQGLLQAATEENAKLKKESAELKATQQQQPEKDNTDDHSHSKEEGSDSGHLVNSGAPH